MHTFVKKGILIAQIIYKLLTLLNSAKIATLFLNNEVEKCIDNFLHIIPEIVSCSEDSDDSGRFRMGLGSQIFTDTWLFSNISERSSFLLNVSEILKIFNCHFWDAPESKFRLTDLEKRHDNDSNTRKLMIPLDHLFSFQCY